MGGTVRQQGTTDKSYTVTGLAELTEYNNIQVTAYINSVNKVSNVEKVTTDLKDGISYSWDEIAEMAKAISNDTSITDDSDTATVNGKPLKVGQMKILDGKRVRILGFNHDTLSESNTAYGSRTATGKAGISFEYVDFLISSVQMNSTNTNSGGWKEVPLRGTLNGTTYNSLSIKNSIKKVKKEYIPTYNTAPTTMPTTDDYIWLLSCGEIWDNGYGQKKNPIINGTRGYAIATEGKQYKYYKINLGHTNYSNSNDITKKSDYWWLRSPYYDSIRSFCHVGSDGWCTDFIAGNHCGVAPGFAI